VGIAIGAMALAFVQLALVRATRESAHEVAVWITGSLAARATEHVQVIALAVLVLLPLALVLTRPMQLAEMGDDLATVVGVPVGPVCPAALGGPLFCCGAVVAVVAAVAYFGLTAPQIGRGFTRCSGLGLLDVADFGDAVLVFALVEAAYAMHGSNFQSG